MKNVLKLIIVSIISSIIYLALLELLTFFFNKNIKPDISWGLAFYYNYFIFITLLLLSILTSLFQKIAFYIVVTLVLLAFFIYSWISCCFSNYPNRTITIIFVGTIVYNLTHFYANLFVKNG